MKKWLFLSIPATGCILMLISKFIDNESIFHAGFSIMITYAMYCFYNMQKHRSKFIKNLLEIQKIRKEADENLKRGKKHMMEVKEYSKYLKEIVGLMEKNGTLARISASNVQK